MDSDSMSSTLKSAFSDYIVFVDESGDHSLEVINPRYPVFVLAFCVLPCKGYVEQLTPLLRQLKMQLFGHDIVVLHEHDIRKKTGPFAGLDKETRGILMERLTCIIFDSPMTLIGIVIDKEKQREHLQGRGHVYAFAVRQGLERLADFLTARDQMDRTTHVVFEARGPVEDRELAIEFQRVCAGDNRDKTIYPFKIVIASKKVNSEGLQLADLVARPIGLRTIRPNQQNRTWPVLETKLFSDPRKQKGPQETSGA